MVRVSRSMHEKPVRADEWLVPVLFVFAAALSACTIRRAVAPHDEGLMLQAAARVADGQWPYRDFWINYGPAQPLVLGALWKVLGPSLLAWRVMRVALDACVAVLVYALARRGAPVWLGGLCAARAAGGGAAAAGRARWPGRPGPGPTRRRSRSCSGRCSPRRGARGWPARCAGSPRCFA